MKINASVLSEKILAKMCEDERVASLDYDVYYETDIIESTEVRILSIRRCGESICVGTLIDGKEVELFALDPSENVLEELGTWCSWQVKEYYDEVYELIVEKCGELSSIGLEHILEVRASEDRCVRYAVVSLNGAIAMSEKLIWECGEYMLPQFSEVDFRSECMVTTDALQDVLIDYRSIHGFPVIPGNMIVYQEDGQQVQAVYISDIEKPNLLCNGGDFCRCTNYHCVPTFNYTPDTVANDQYVFLFSKKEVVPVGSLDMEGMYFATDVNFDYDWQVVSEVVSGIGLISVCNYRCFDEGRNAIKEILDYHKNLYCKEGKSVEEVSCFGLESVVKEKCRKRQGVSGMTDKELAESLGLDGLEIVGDIRRVALFKEALAFVVSRLKG